jgi:hypothetical protein
MAAGRESCTILWLDNRHYVAKGVMDCSRGNRYLRKAGLVRQQQTAGSRGYSVRPSSSQHNSRIFHLNIFSSAAK